MLIGVIGGNEATTDVLETAYTVGLMVAARGHVLVCGGRGGVMREACRGAKAAGGVTVGILPGEDLSDANEYLDIPVVTGLGSGRNIIVARTANALIAIGGAYGTLSEIAFGLMLGRTVVGLGTWELRDSAGREAPIVRVAGAEAAVLACEAAVEGSIGDFAD
jgi:uncharacterized protein (TIGR00725 family)